MIVEIYLPSIHCKVSNAEFDITPFQFTFHCAPYYLRLQFQSRPEVGGGTAGRPSLSLISPTATAGKAHGLCEGKGERATYDLSTSSMTVFLPKAVDGELFLHLDMPNLLLATHAQRKAMLAAKAPAIEVLQATSADDDGTLVCAADAVAEAERRRSKAAGEEETDAVADDEEWEEVEEDEEAEDDEAGGCDDGLETEFVQMQIGGQPDPFAENEAKMAAKTSGTDASLLALEGKLGAEGDATSADPKGSVDANGWFIGGEKRQSEPSDAATTAATANKASGGSILAADKDKVFIHLDKFFVKGSLWAGRGADKGYGFNKEFTGVFEVMSRTDAQQNTNYVGEVIDLPDPDAKSRLDRRQERLLRETEAYEDAAFWGCVNEDVRDPNSELGELFAALMGWGGARRFVPWYQEAFEAQLASSGMSFVSAARAAAPSTTMEEAAASLFTPSAIPRLAVEEDGEDFGTNNVQSAGGTKGVIVAWEGNTGTIVEPTKEAAAAAAAAAKKKGPLISEIISDNERLLAATTEDAAAAGASDTAAGLVLASRPVIAATTTAAPPVAAAPQQAAPALRLAIPSTPPAVAFTREEAQLLLHIAPRASPITPIPSGAEEVCALAVDLLCAFVFDYLTTLGDGSVESVWTVTRLSPSLSFLDAPRNVYEALVGFSRRVFIYPYIRHWALVHRVARDVGIILLSGPQSVIKALLGLKHTLDNTEHHHTLTKLFVNPLIGYLSGCLASEGDAAAIAASLQRTALQIHAVMTFEPSEAVASGAVVPPHIIDMLCDGMEGATDAAEAAAVDAAADAAAEEDAAAAAGAASTSAGRGLVLGMLKASAERGRREEEERRRVAGEGAVDGRDICRRFGAIQYEPLAPFTIGLPIDMEEDEEDGDEAN